ncbi:MAG: ATP-binding protein [Cyanobacteria bacterium P01_C01_bin.70]
MSQTSAVPTPPQSSPPQVSPVPARPGEQPGRSPEEQAKVDLIGKIDVYAGTDRDTALFQCLNNWRDLNICGRVLTNDRLGLSKALQFYLRDQVKLRGGLLQIPAPVAYIEVEQNGSATDVLLLILDFLSNPLDCGTLRDLRSRVWGTLKAYGVNILIVNNADLLSFNAFTELVRISEKLGIPIVIAGQPYLNDAINPSSNAKKKYTNVYNTFLRSHTFSMMSPGDAQATIKMWEASLKWPKPMQLSEDAEIVTSLHENSRGQLRPLIEALREVALWKLDHPKAQVNYKNINNLLMGNLQPCPQPGKS